MTKLTPKENNAISDIIDGANPLFFSNLSKLLGIPYPDTREIKEKLFKQILKAWEDKR